MKVNSSSIKAFVFRLEPKSDLKKSIVEFAKRKGIKAGVILTCVGSLEQINLRFANRKKGTLKKGFFEIVSLTGTVSSTSCHLHLSVADKKGNVTGGHLLDDNLVFTTAELVVGDLIELRFERAIDNTYGYHELKIKHRKSKHAKSID